MIPKIPIEDYSYHLPANKIAHFPLSQRDRAKLLVYTNGAISDHIFYELPQFLPTHTLLVCNNSKVFEARLLFPSNTAKSIEVFCMEIVQTNNTNAIVKCMIGNLRKWKSPTLVLEKKHLTLQAEKIKSTNNGLHQVQLQWNDSTKNIFDILHIFGHTPLPPYIKRSDIEEDKKNYQTIFAEMQGSAAAPTAGLHFTLNVLEELQQKNISLLELTLHVGGGTFLPVKTPYVDQHTMHSEQVIFSKTHIQTLITHIENKYPICAVGTTSIRALESLHSLGISLAQNPLLDIDNIEISQWLSYETNLTLSYIESLKLILQAIEKNQRNEIIFKTKICIVLGYKIQSAHYLITNFHQPNSTLLLLIAAFVGKDWKNIYDHALLHNYRFLSYGDTSLLQLKS